jgi:hypothetical protein
MQNMMRLSVVQPPVMMLLAVFIVPRHGSGVLGMMLGH